MRIRFSVPVWILAACALAASSAAAVEIVRGPYLQRTSTNSIVVRWRTDVATDTWVGWGELPGVYDGTVSAASPTTEHRLTVTDLAAKTQYYYAVGTTLDILAGGDGAHHFRTVAPAGDPGSQRIWTFGDSGETSNQPPCGEPSTGATEVLDGYLSWSGAVAPDLWLILGDNAYCTGTDAEYQTALFDVYPEMLRTVGIWPVFGNHDALSSDSTTQTGAYFDMFSLPRSAEAGGVASGTEAYFSFDSGDVHIVQLDSADSGLDPGSPMLAWLASDLTANTHPWLIAAFHHPPYARGTHDSDNPSDSGGIMKKMRENVVPILEAHGVDLVLSGHSHDYERTYLIDGHYGTTDTFDPATMLKRGGNGNPAVDGAYVKVPGPHSGTVYAVVGIGSRTEGVITPWPAMAVGLDELGSLAIDLQGRTLDARMIRPDGSVADRFRIFHLVPLFNDGFELGNASAWTEISAFATSGR
ncbi:MAG: metallophosphoesterase family protein [Thermoanaerobaculia bacterium]